MATHRSGLEDVPCKGEGCPYDHTPTSWVARGVREASEGLDRLHAAREALVHPDIDKPNSVTHFLCPEGPTKDGQPDATHHLTYAGGVPRCVYCKKSHGDLSRAHGLDKR